MILVGVCGGVAAYKSCELVRLLVRAGHDVQVVQTPTAERFVGPTTFAALSRRPVLTDSAERSVPASGGVARRRAAVHRAADARPRSPGSRTARRPTCCSPRRLAFTAADRGRAGHEPDGCGSADATRANAELLRRRGVELVGPGHGRHRRGRARRRPDGRAGGDRRRDRAPPCRRRPAGAAAACWSPPAAPASRSTPFATSATARAAGWAWPWPTRPPAAVPTSRCCSALGRSRRRRTST